MFSGQGNTRGAVCGFKISKFTQISFKIKNKAKLTVC